MAIELLKKVTVVSQEGTRRRLLRAINNLGVMEIRDIKDSLAEDVPFTNYEASTETADDNLHKIEFILNLMNIHAPEQESFIKGLTPLPLVTSQKEIESIVGEYNLGEHYHQASQLDEIHRRSERIINEITAEISELAPIKDLPLDLEEFSSLSYVNLVIGYVPNKNLARLDPSAAPWENADWEVAAPAAITEEDKTAQIAAPASPTPGDRTRIIFAFLKNDEEGMRKALASIEFEEYQLPKRRFKIADRVGELKEDLEKYREEAADVARKVQLLAAGDAAGSGRRPLLVLKAYWTNVRNRQIASEKGVQGKWIYMIHGFVRAKDIDAFTDMMKREFPETMVTVEDPSPDEEVPVSISVPYLFRPIKLLTEMFGLPSYRSFDPTPFMQFNFYVFFGICYSDVGYGLMLVLLSSYLMKKTKEYSGVYDFARILLYGGISSIIFGAILGSWFGDLYKPEYLGKNNFLIPIQEALILLDPMDKTILALVLALGIGVLNQFLGISLKIYGCIRNGDWMGAFSDGFCWIVTLTGLLIVISNVFVPVPPAFFTAGLWLFGIGAAGLVLTQGRDNPHPAGKIATGLISLYGIFGGYGIAAFIGDTLSYCRLLALGLTTSIVAMSFNLMAGMLKDIPYVGFILFVTVLLIGHLFNFLISVLGAFVHSMRLIFVEFFGRFYEAGARPFQPLEFDSQMCVMRKSN